MANKNEVSVVIQAVDQVTGPLRGINTRLKGWSNGALSILKGVTAGFAAVGLGAFFRSAVSESLEAERRFTALGVAVRNAGGDFAALRPQVEATVNALAAKTGIADDELVGALSRLITLTGDAQLGMENLSLVADVAKARGLDLASASDLVGKALNGNTRALRAVGIETKDHAEGMRLLRERYSGFAEAEGKTLTGTLNRIREGWKNVLEAVGDAITGNDRVKASGDRLVDVLIGMERWIRDNEQAIGDLTGAVITLAGAFGTVLNPVLKATGFH